MKSIKLRKVWVSLAVAVFLGVMIFNTQLVYKNSDPVSSISLSEEPNSKNNLILENLMALSYAQTEENNAPGRYRTVGGDGQAFGDFENYCCPHEFYTNCPQGFTNPDCETVYGC